MKKIIHLVLVMFLACKVFSQDTLPKFTLTERGDRVTISWTNPYQSLIQLNVQRSYDSLRNFSTIYSATSPELPQNGYTDTRPASNRNYYRIFYVLEGGSYFFAKSKRANGTTSAPTTTNTERDVPDTRDLTNAAFTNVVPGDKRIVTIKIRDTVFKQLSINAFRNFRDSILRLTKDTLYLIDDATVGISPYVMPAAYKASEYVFINKDGYINVSVPLVSQKKYSLKFFEEDGTPLFEIHNVKETPLILEKANFVHAGWFRFELYEDNKLKEKNRLYIAKDF